MATRTALARRTRSYIEAVSHVSSTRRVSISGLQRYLKIGYNRTARIVEEMEAAGVVSAPNSTASAR